MSSMLQSLIGKTFKTFCSFVWFEKQKLQLSGRLEMMAKNIFHHDGSSFARILAHFQLRGCNILFSFIVLQLGLYSFIVGAIQLDSWGGLCGFIARGYQVLSWPYMIWIAAIIICDQAFRTLYGFVAYCQIYGQYMQAPAFSRYTYMAL